MMCAMNQTKRYTKVLQPLLFLLNGCRLGIHISNFSKILEHSGLYDHILARPIVFFYYIGLKRLYLSANLVVTAI